LRQRRAEFKRKEESGTTVVLVIAAFNYYVSVTRTISFKKKFSEMCLVSLGVAAISFVIGLLVKRFLGLDI